MLPRVVVYNAVSLDGRNTSFNPDIGKYYELVAYWQEDATLVSSQTILVSGEEAPEETEEDFKPLGDSAGDTRPLLVIVDSRGRVRIWHYLLSLPYWRAGVALCSRSTPSEYLTYLRKRGIDYIAAGSDHVDLRAALEELNSRYGVKTVRADSGGILNGILIRQGLADELSLLVHPGLVGSATSQSFFNTDDGSVVPLRLIHLERLENDLIWLRYEVTKVAMTENTDT